MFPYPSGSGLHVGHAVGYIGTDIVARRKRMEGFNVLHPMGWDAFGLPAEQYAIQTGKHPRATTAREHGQLPPPARADRALLRLVARDRHQRPALLPLDAVDLRAAVRARPRLPGRGAGLVVRGAQDRARQRGGDQRPLRARQPPVRAAAAEAVDAAHHGLRRAPARGPRRARLARVDQDPAARVDRPLRGRGDRLRGRGPRPSELAVFTTRPDTLFGATFMVVAPEHPLRRALATPAQRAAVEALRARRGARSPSSSAPTSPRRRPASSPGAYALNPAFERGDPRARIPIWVADYVLAELRHRRDHGRARPRRARLRVRAGATTCRSCEVVRPPSGATGLARRRLLHRRRHGDQLGPARRPADAARRSSSAIELLEERGAGRARVTYKLRDWLFSRQRYWGEPFPLLHLDDGSDRRACPTRTLPVALPRDGATSRPRPTARRRSRARRSGSRRRDPRDGRRARGATPTRCPAGPARAGTGCASWTRERRARRSRREAERYWGPVDLYVGGAAHAVMHLLYARFWHKVLFDAGPRVDARSRSRSSSTRA